MKKRKKIKTSNIVLIVSFIIVLIFSISVLVLSALDRSVSDTLIEWFYKFFGFELVSLAGIKISKVHNGYVNNNNIDGGI